MTPMDIEMKVFKKARFGGYNTDDVNEFLDEIIRAFEDTQRENIALEQKVGRLDEKLDYYKTMEKTLQNTMILAEKTSEEITAVAKERAEQILLEGTFQSDRMIEKAKQEVYSVKQNYEDLHKQYQTATIQMKRMLQTQLDLLETQTISSEEFNAIPEMITEVETVDENYYTKEYQIINEEDAI